MPIVQLTQVNPQISFAVWQIDESLDELMALYPFSEMDKAILNSQKVIHRRMEWLAARLALKSLLDTQKVSNFHIVKDEFGKPHLKDSPVGISISHTKNYGAALINLAGPTGIDIEYPRAQIQRIARKFLHADEKAWAQKDMNKLTQIWSAKEALYKLHGRTQLTFATQLYVEKPQNKYPTRGAILEHGESNEFRLHYHEINGMMICLAF